VNEEEAESAEARNWNIGIMEWWNNRFWWFNYFPNIPFFHFILFCVLCDLCG
jgi:hypothetical protein